MWWLSKNNRRNKIFQFLIPSFLDLVDVAPPNFAIVYRPKDVLIHSDASLSANFECVPSLWNKFPAEIKWLLNGNELTIDGLEVKTEFSNRRLILSNVVNLVGKNNYQSKITCEAKTSDKRLIERADAKLEIYSKNFLKFVKKIIFTEKPIINKKDLAQEVTKKIGESFRIECKTQQAWPRAKFSWYLNKNKVCMQIFSDLQGATKKSTEIWSKFQKLFFLRHLVLFFKFSSTHISTHFSCQISIKIN